MFWMGMCEIRMELLGVNRVYDLYEYIFPSVGGIFLWFASFLGPLWLVSSYHIID